MTKRLIEVNDEKLEAVRELLGTRTLKATVDEAFDELLALSKRRKALLADRGVDESALADPEARRAAWGLTRITWATPQRSRADATPR